MPKHVGFVARWSQYLGARLAATAVEALPADAASDLFARGGEIAHRLDARHRRRALEHLAAAMPELPPAERERIILGSYRHLGSLLAEILHTPRRLTPSTWHNRIALDPNDEGIGRVLEGGPAIVLTGHLGNWELLGYLAAVVGLPLHAVARPLNNPLLNRWLVDLRERRGVCVITKFHAAEAMLRVLDREALLGLVADQDAGPRGVFVPFFGRFASTYKSPAVLATRKSVPIICGYAHRIGPGFRYEVGVQDLILPEQWEAQPDPQFYITARYTRAIELMVRRCPEQYLWSYKRWRHRPDPEQVDELIDAAAKLPWMTAEAVDRLARRTRDEAAGNTPP